MAPDSGPVPGRVLEVHGMPDPSPLPAQKVKKGGKFGRGRRAGAPMANDYIPRGDAEFKGWPTSSPTRTPT